MFLVSSCSCLCPIQWSQVLEERRCRWSSADRRCSNYIWVIDNFIAYWSASYIRDLETVVCREGEAVLRLLHVRTSLGGRMIASGCEIWLSVGSNHPFIIRLPKYRLKKCLSFKALLTHVTNVNFHVFSDATDIPSALTVDKLMSLGLCKEYVKESRRCWTSIQF